MGRALSGRTLFVGRRHAGHRADHGRLRSARWRSPASLLNFAGDPARRARRPGCARQPGLLPIWSVGRGGAGGRARVSTLHLLERLRCRRVPRSRSAISHLSPGSFGGAALAGVLALALWIIGHPEHLARGRPATRLVPGRGPLARASSRCRPPRRLTAVQASRYIFSSGAGRRARCSGRRVAGGSGDRRGTGERGATMPVAGWWRRSSRGTVPGRWPRSSCLTPTPTTWAACRRVLGRVPAVGAVIEPGAPVRRSALPGALLDPASMQPDRLASRPGRRALHARRRALHGPAPSTRAGPDGARTSTRTRWCCWWSTASSRRCSPATPAFRRRRGFGELGPVDLLKVGHHGSRRQHRRAAGSTRFARRPR